VQGTVTAGGVPGPFEKIVDLSSGFSRMIQRNGKDEWSGFDGHAWVASNGMVNTVDLPALIRDARSRAFVERAGWRDFARAAGLRLEEQRSDSLVIVTYRPPDASDVRVTFDAKTGLVREVVIETDDGPVVTTYDDWRAVGSVKIPFSLVERTNTGEETAFQVQSAKTLRRPPANAFERPRAAPTGLLLPQSPQSIAFAYPGSRKAHILVPATVSGIETQIIFDTGAANYFSPEAARRFGLRVAGGLNLGGPGSSSTTGGFAAVDRIAIGPAELRNQTVMVGPVPWPNTSAPGKPGIEGSAGYEFLSEFRTTIDYPAMSLTFESFAAPNVAKGTRLPFVSDGHSPFIEASVDGQSGYFRLDTGDGGAVTLFPSFAKAHALYQSDGPASDVGGGVGGSVRGRRIVVSELRLGGVTFRQVPGRLSLNTAGSFASRSLAGNIGGGVLQCFRLTFDYRERSVTFEARQGEGICANIGKSPM
jgi:predicted aspartyl protease